MTQKEANLLVEIITKVVRKELSSFKKQLLSEGYSPQAVPVKRQAPAEPVNKLTEVHKNFRKTFQSTNKSTNSRLSKDPVLNSLLMETISIEDAEREAEEQLLESGVNLPVDGNGRLMSGNSKANYVYEAMNRDYSGMFKPKANQNQAQSQASSAKSQLRSDFMAIMESEDYMPTQPSHQPNQRVPATTAYPSVEPFSGEEEDMAWLNEVQ